MENESSVLPAPSIESVQIVANPNALSWSQAYHAGQLFAVLSLTQNESDDLQSLGAIGKELINSLEEEFFTLETKNLISIKAAISQTITKIPSNVKAELLVCVIPHSPESTLTQHVAYLFTLGKGVITLKRSDKVGVLLSENKETPETLLASSGFLEDKDILILQTDTFTKTISHNDLSNALQNSNTVETAETLTPRIHSQEKGDATAMLISYSLPKNEDVITEESLIPPSQPEKKPFVMPSIPLPHLKHFSIGTPFIKRLFFNRKGIFILLALSIVLILGVSVFTAINAQEQQKQQAVFEEMYQRATDAYAQGEGLAGLNKNLADDFFNQSKKILEEKEFKKGSKEEQQRIELLEKVNTALEGKASANIVSTKEVPSSTNALLEYILTHSDSPFVAQDENALYAITQKDIKKIDKGNKQEEPIITNDSTWSTLGGFAAYFGNLYVLDKKTQQIIKLVPSGSTFTNSNYLSDSADLTKAKSLAIDGSIWVLSSDGTILKFTQGKKDNFSISNLKTPLKNPHTIVTSADFNSLYVLDRENSRVVVLSKTGSYEKEYASPTLLRATALDVSETDKKIWFLSDKKIFEFELK